MNESQHYYGQRISFGGALCTVRFVGRIAGTTGTWLGVEWDDPARGKHDGTHNGVRYFSCRSEARTAASMVRPSRPADPPHTFLQALRIKYAPDPKEEASSTSQTSFSGKVVEEVGFDKIRRKLADVHELRNVILDGLQLNTATGAGEPSIGATCPKVTRLDLSRNLFEHFSVVVDICAQLPKLSIFVFKFV